METKLKNKESDPLQALKYRGYCWAHTAPGDDTSLEDFVHFAKFFLCRQTKRLWKDSIWENYTDEDILVEYFAHLYSIDKASRTQFEVSAFSGSEVYGEEVYDWLDRMVAKNQEEMAEKAAGMPEKISFSPESNKDKEE